MRPRMGVVASPLAVGLMLPPRVLCNAVKGSEEGQMPEIELLTVANHAEAINGLLYLSGAGWTDLRRPVMPNGKVPVNYFGIGLATLVSWNETNQRHRVSIRVENADGKELFKVEGDIEMGRPPGATKGMDFRGVMAVNAQVQFPAAGVYRIVASVAENRRSVTFRVHDMPTPAALQTPPPPTNKTP